MGFSIPPPQCRRVNDMAARQENQSNDLFFWQARAELEARRKALQNRINKLSKHSHKQVALITRMQDLTTQLLELETKS